MSTISASTTTTTAYKVTADTTGTLVLQTGSTPTTAVTIDASQNVGVGTASPLGLLDVASSSTTLARVRSTTGTTAGSMYQNSASGTTSTDGLFVGIDGSLQGYLYNYENAPLIFGTNNATRMLLDTSGNLGVGTTNPLAQIHINGSSDSYFNAGLRVNRSATPGQYGTVNYANGTFTLTATDTALSAPSIAFRTSTDGSTSTERARINSSGYFIASGNTTGYTGSAAHVFAYNTNQGDRLLQILTGNYGGQNIVQIYGVTSEAGINAGGTAMGVSKNGGTNRSINAAGTINASGADYAEYMTKAGDFTIAKGDVVGIDAEGKLTNVFADAVSFVVKSTDPSYVGGDSWGSEAAIGVNRPEKPLDDADDEVKAQYETDKAAFEAALEAARQLVDRIAFSGQVPVNVTGATAGQYIIPVNDNGSIKGEAVSNPTFEQYQQAVGKVIAIEQDGRARIIVKVA